MLTKKKPAISPGECAKPTRRRCVDCFHVHGWYLFVVIVFLAMGWISYRHIGSGFMPSMDEGGFVLDYRSEPGTSLTETDRLLRQVEAVLRAPPTWRRIPAERDCSLAGG